jgi:hypothetical protein
MLPDGNSYGSIQLKFPPDGLTFRPPMRGDEGDDDDSGPDDDYMLSEARPTKEAAPDLHVTELLDAAAHFSPTSQTSAQHNAAWSIAAYGTSISPSVVRMAARVLASIMPSCIPFLYPHQEPTPPHRAHHRATEAAECHRCPKEAVIQHLEELHGVPAPKFGQRKASVDFFEMPMPKKGVG